MTGCLFCQKQDNPSGLRTHDTCNVINGEPCIPCVEYTSLQAEVHEMQALLENKLLRLREIREKINRQHDCMLIQLPRELVNYIFELAASPFENQTAMSAPLREGEKYAPLFLGSVCRAWRDVAWSMPQLWTFIYIHVPTAEDLPRRLELATQWLARSGEHLPLSIHFFIPKMYDFSDIPIEVDMDALIHQLINTFEPLMKLIGLHSRRWKVLCGTAQSIFLESVSAYFQSAPILQTLQIIQLGLADESIFFGREGTEYLPSQPNSIVLKNVEPNIVNVDWIRVTSLTLTSAWVEDAVEILPRIPNLETLVFGGRHGRSVYEPSPFVGTAIRHPKVHSLSLHGLLDELDVLLGALILPSLTRLSINLLHDPNLLLRVTSFLDQSCCHLVSMSLTNVPNAPNTIFDLLDHVDSLIDLEIVNKVTTRGDCHFLQALIYRTQSSNSFDSQNPLLPKLQRLTYTLHQFNFVSKALMRQIVDPSWQRMFPQWKTLFIMRYPKSVFYYDIKNICYELESLGNHVRQRLLELVESGIELFLPLKVAREDILKSLGCR